MSSLRTQRLWLQVAHLVQLPELVDTRDRYMGKVWRDIQDLVLSPQLELYVVLMLYGNTANNG